jgi:trehalose 6-phosphate phosphatase
MRPHAPAVSMHDVWRLSPVARLRPRDVLLVTDFDGTLADIAPDPAHASMLPASAAALKRLAASLRKVVVLSSRPTSDLENLVQLPGLELIGDSGLRFITPDERSRLDRFNIEAARQLSRYPGVWLEMKPGATAIHHRHSEATREELMVVIEQIVPSLGLHALPGRRVIEVMPRDRPKGDSLQLLIERLQPGGIICMGDDENDRPMFELLAKLDRPHLAVGVWSAEAPEDLFSLCDLVVTGPGEASRFLTMVAEWATQIQSSC